MSGMRGQNVQPIGELDIVPGAVAARAGTWLMLCGECGLAFRPTDESPGSLVASYADLDGKRWSGDARPDHRLVAASVRERLDGGAVLDVGCWEGELLATLGPEYQKFGLEPSLAAARVAGSRGVTVLGPTLDDLADASPTFDAVLMVDVIEHVSNPLGTLRRAEQLLAPGGFSVVTTGDRASLTWRMMPLDYWYYSSDHIAFLSLRWFAWAARELDMRVAAAVRFSHTDSSLFQRFFDLCSASAFRCLCPPHPLLARRRCGWRGRVLGGRRPWTVHWRDHLLLVLEREPGVSTGRGRKHGRCETGTSGRSMTR